MRVLGVFGALWSVILIMVLAVTASMGHDLNDSRLYESGLTPYSRAVRTKKTADAYPLAEVLCRSHVAESRVAMKRLKKKKKRYIKAKKKYGETDSRVKKAHEAYARAGRHAQATNQDVITKTERRSVGIIVAMVFALLGSLVVVIGSGRAGGAIMILAALIPAALAPVAVCPTSLILVLGLGALVLGAKKQPKDVEAKRAAAAAQRLSEPPEAARPVFPPAPAPSAPPSRASLRVAGMVPTKLWPRTIAEKRDYVRIQPCKSCGADGLEATGGGLFQGEDGAWFTKDSATCKQCGTSAEFTFYMGDDPLPPGGIGVRFAGDTPSAIIDAGQFLELSDVYSRMAPGSIEGLPGRERQRGIAAMSAAIVYLEEALKFIPAGGDEVPGVALFSRASAQLLDKLPGQFRRARLEARLGAYRKVLREMDSSSELCDDPPASGLGQVSPAGNYEVILEDYGASKIKCIKLVREITRMGLREAKELVDRAPSVVKSGLSKEAANDLARGLAEAGARASARARRVG